MAQKEKFNPFVYIKGVPGRGKEVITELLKKSGNLRIPPDFGFSSVYYLSGSFGNNPSCIYYMNPLGEGIGITRIEELSEERLNFLNSNYTEISLSKPILDEKEREYLSAVIRPWRNRVTSITKVCIDSERSFIGMKIEDSDASWLPYFKGGMYKGMEADREYTLKELNL